MAAATASSFRLEPSSSDKAGENIADPHVSQFSSSRSTSSRGSQRDSRSNTGSQILSAGSARQPTVFIRKIIFHPELPIRFDYHGRRYVDQNMGSLQSVMAMLLQLNKAELKLPRRVYQRGYRDWNCLVEEVIADTYITLAAQLPKVIVTSLGPMHEVTRFAMGVWDLVYQPVQSLYRTASGRYGGDVCELGVDGGEGFIHGLQRGTRSFSNNTLWAALQLSLQGVRAVQSVAETAYDLVTPGPALRSKHFRLRQPADIREGFGNAVSAMSRGLQMVTDDLREAATRSPIKTEHGYKGPVVGVVGEVLRQIPPTLVTPVVAGCEATASVLGGFRNQLRPEAKLEDEQKWKDTHGM